MLPASLRDGTCLETDVDKKLLEILACPLCKGPLLYDKENQELICKADRLAFPVEDDIPVMLVESAREIPADVEF